MSKFRNRINEEIKSEKVRLIDENGNQVGIVDLSYALNKARTLNLDLVEIQPKLIPPVVKIMNYGKFKFAINKKNLQAKKKQKESKTKEIKFRLNTANNDYLIKIRNIKTFLLNGNKTKITVCFKGREMVHKQLGLDLMTKICKDLEEYSKIDFTPRFEGKSITTIISPLKK